jgi:hypothetical protein
MHAAKAPGCLTPSTKQQGQIIVIGKGRRIAADLIRGKIIVFLMTHMVRKTRHLRPAMVGSQHQEQIIIIGKGRRIAVGLIREKIIAFLMTHMVLKTRHLRPPMVDSYIM